MSDDRAEETPFADQVEREFKAIQEFWDRLRANPEFRRAARAAWMRQRA